MARFEYLKARTLGQAVALAERHGDKARIVAGSTDFLIRWRQGVWNPQCVVDISSIPSLKRVSFSPRNGLRLGGLVTIRTVETYPVIRERYSALSAAASAFAGVQVRNLATVAGNVCNASPAGDMIPALLAFDAQCRIVGPLGERWVPLDQFFTGPGSTILGQGEILAELRSPTPTRGTGSLYIKHSPRGAMDISTVGVASVISLKNGNRTCRDAKIALGAVGPTPLRAYAAEEVLRGQTITPELLREAAQLAQSCASPIDDVRGTATHRRAMVGVLAQRTLEQAASMARTGAIPFQSQRSLAVEAAF
jgi:carbon-monoxide dehydrogenase medium subunit